MNTKFKVGDVVRVVSGNWTKSVSAPITIEKQHAGNGNLKVDDSWFDENGWERRGRDAWGSGRTLVLDGSPQCIEIIREARLERARNELSRVDWRQLPADFVLEVAASVRAHTKPKDPQP